jgi:ABC-2 type transport system ATP-binding protein
MIEVRAVSKAYGRVQAVSDLSFTVQPGAVTGFLGPNGSGKSTTMRMIVGLDRPDRGQLLVNGIPYRSHVAPLRAVGTLLDARQVHPRRSARTHLLSLAATIGEGAARVDEVLSMVGLDTAARRPVGTFSLGMAQRLGIAAAMIGDPPVLMFDEPANGLDPDGIVWLRQLTKHLAAQGRSVLVSSHLLSEIALTAEHLIIVGRGRLIADLPTKTLLEGSGDSVVVRSTDRQGLADLLIDLGASHESVEDGAFLVRGASPEDVARAALDRRVMLVELTPRRQTLEEAFMQVTAGAQEYAAEAQLDPTGGAR